MLRRGKVIRRAPKKRKRRAMYGSSKIRRRRPIALLFLGDAIIFVKKVAQTKKMY